MSDSGPKAEDAQVVEILTSTAGFKISPLVIDVSDLKQHPIAEAEKFPKLSDKELKELADDIQTHRLHERIVLYEGKILEGLHRYQALKRNGLKFTATQFIEFDAVHSGDPKLYVISRNVFRRHLNQGQRAAYGHEYLEGLGNVSRGRPPGKSGPAAEENNRSSKECATARESAPRAEEKMSSIDDNLLRADKQRKAEAAAVTGSSVQSIEQFAHLKKIAPEQAAEVKAGTKTLHAAIEEAAGKPGKRKAKPLVMEFKDGHTLDQIFHTMFAKGRKTLEVRVIGRGRAIFTLDADVKPVIGVTESEIIKIAAAQDPPVSQLDAIDMLDRCKAKTRTYDDWAGALRTWRRRGWLLSQQPNSKPSKTQRAPSARSTAMTPAQRDAAAAEQERKIKASLDGEWKRR